MAQRMLEKIKLSSDKEEEVSSEGSESDSESESELTPTPPPSSRKTQAKLQSSSEELESGTDSPPKMYDKDVLNIKPLASKPMDDEPLRKPRSRTPNSRYSPPPSLVNGKRKTVAVAVPSSENAGEKKSTFQRIWSADDEIELIKGMIKYVEEKGKYPIADINDFHEFVKNSLTADVNNGQMIAKIKRLKEKFKNNSSKIEKTGKIRSLSNPHEKKMYHLSEKLWVNNSKLKAAISLNADLSGVQTMKFFDEDILNRGLEMCQRVWSADDEIDLIKGMIKYIEEKGKNPISDVNDFHEFVKNSLNADVNNGQMITKIKRLKSKFKNNSGKIEQTGKVRSFSNPHEKKMYELSEKLWGNNSSNKKAAIVSCSTTKVNPNPNYVGSGEANVNGGHSRGEIRFPITDEDIMNRGLEMLSGAKKVELEEKWSDLKVQELEHYVKKMELMKAQAELVLNAIKKSRAR